MKFLIPILLIIISGTGFFMLVSPKYEEIKILKQEVDAYDNALANSKVLTDERDKLATKYNNINKSDLERLNKLLPDNIDNIRMILEIEKLALYYDMYLKDIKYDDKKENEENVEVQAGVQNNNFNSEYGSWDLEFTTEGSYGNFISLLKDIEKNLRLVDVVSVDFVSSDLSGSKKDSDNYKYIIKIRTYWLKR